MVSKHVKGEVHFNHLELKMLDKLTLFLLFSIL